MTRAFLIGSLILAGGPAIAGIRAVLVGASDYVTLDADLKGPANDVRLMAETLVARGVRPADMVVLTTDPTGLPEGVVTGKPFRMDILRAMTGMADRSTAGDTLLFYFSGHGAQAPDLSGDEGGGYDEILLPADAAGWKGAIGGVENSILDDELQAWAQTALSRGVKVVGLIDACHSATGFRALGGAGVARVIDGTVLGIPDEFVPSNGAPAPSLTGEFVFLYSSQSDQRSFEFPLADGVTWHGEFTLRLARTLQDAPGVSWAQVLAMTSDAMAQGPARQVPDGEGPLLQGQVFGEGRGTVRLPIADGKLAAGLLQGLGEGAEMALFVGPAGGDPLAVLTLGKVMAREAVFVGTLPEAAAWAELVSTPPPAPLTLAAPVLASPGDGHDYGDWRKALPAPGPNPDLVPILVDGSVALAGAEGVLDPEGPGSSPRIRLEGDETPAEAVARVLEHAAHGLRLREVLAGATGRGLTTTPPLTMTVARRAGLDGCSAVAAPEIFDPANGVAPCDQIWLTLTNTGGSKQDVSVLYFTRDFQVLPIWPFQDLSNRLAPGETAQVGMQVTDAATAGIEEIWVLAVPVEAGAARVDLTRLAAPEMPRAFGDTTDPMSLWLAGRMNPEIANRGFSPKPAPLTMLRQIVRLQPTTGDPAAPMEN